MNLKATAPPPSSSSSFRGHVKYFRKNNYIDIEIEGLVIDSPILPPIPPHKILKIGELVFGCCFLVVWFFLFIIFFSFKQTTGVYSFGRLESCKSNPHLLDCIWSSPVDLRCLLSK